MDAVYRLELSARGHEPHRRRTGFHAQISCNPPTTRPSSKKSRRPSTASPGKKILCCAKAAGTPGVGSVFDLSNAQVAKILGAKVIIVSQGGIGKPIDEVALNQALFEKEGVEIIGVILNKVLGEKVDFITEFARRGLKRKGLDLLGVMPHRSKFFAIQPSI